MPFSSILCTPLPVPPWANGLVFGAGFVLITATGAAYYLSMRHVFLLRLLFYGGSSMLLTLAVRGALSILGTQGACERAVGAFVFSVSAWSGEGGLDTDAAVVLGHLVEAACAVLLCRAALAQPQRCWWWLPLALVPLFVAAVACWQAALDPERVAAQQLESAAAAGRAGAVAAAAAGALGSAAARVFARHLLGSALCELSWLYLFVRGGISVAAHCAATGALAPATAAGAEAALASAGWLLATVLLVRRYTRALAQAIVRGPVTAGLAMGEKSAAVLAAQTLCGVSLHHPLMLPVFWALDADSSHAVLWRDCGAGGSFLGVFAPNILAAAGLWDESIVPDVVESDADEDSDYARAVKRSSVVGTSGGGGSKPSGGEGGDATAVAAAAAAKKKQLTYSQQLRLCAGLGCPLLWARARWVASVCVAGLICAAAVALWQLLAAMSGLSVAQARAGAALLPPHCFAKLDPVACVAAAAAHASEEEAGGAGAALAAASRCFTPAAGLADASVIQSGTALVLDAAAAAFIALGALAAAWSAGATAAATLLGFAAAAQPWSGGSSSGTIALLQQHSRRLPALAARHAPHVAELLGAAAPARAHGLAPHEAQLLYGIAPLPLLKAALLCSGVLLVAGRAFPRGLLRAVAWCSWVRARSRAAPAAAAAAAAAAAVSAPASPASPTASLSAIPGAPASPTTSMQETAHPPASEPPLPPPAIIALWFGAVRIAALAATVLVGVVSLQVALPQALTTSWAAGLPLFYPLADAATVQISAAAVLMCAVALMQLLPPPPPELVEQAQLTGLARVARAAAGACLLALCAAVFPLALSVVSSSPAAAGASGGSSSGASSTTDAKLSCSGAEGAAGACSSGLRTLTLCMVSRDGTAQWLGDFAGDGASAQPLESPFAAQTLFLCVAVLGWLWQGRALDSATAAWPRWRRRRVAVPGKPPPTVWTRKNICRIVKRPPRAVLAARAARASAAALAAPAVAAAVDAAVAAVVSGAAAARSSARLAGGAARGREHWAAPESSDDASGNPLAAAAAPEHWAEHTAPRHAPRLRLRSRARPAASGPSFAAVPAAAAAAAAAAPLAPRPAALRRATAAAPAAGGAASVDASPRPASSPASPLGSAPSLAGVHSPPRLSPRRSPAPAPAPAQSPPATRGVVGLTPAASASGGGGESGAGFHMQLRPRNTSAPPTPTSASVGAGHSAFALAKQQAGAAAPQGGGGTAPPSRAALLPPQAPGQPRKAKPLPLPPASPPRAPQPPQPLLLPPKRHSRAAQTFARSRRLRSAAAVLSRIVPVARALLRDRDEAAAALAAAGVLPG